MDVFRYQLLSLSNKTNETFIKLAFHMIQQHIMSNISVVCYEMLSTYASNGLSHIKRIKLTMTISKVQYLNETLM